MVQFLNRFTNHPPLVKWKDHGDQVGHGSPIFAVDIREIIPVRKLMDSTSLALREAYIKGKLEVEGSLYEAPDHFLEQMGRFSASRLHLRELLHPSNSRKNQKIEISSHYDIGNDSYRLRLDETTNYSCGYFKAESDTFYEAQVNKTDYILKKLALREDISSLNMDCGWGFPLIRAAREYGTKGAGITLNTEQYDGFKKRIGEEGLEHLLNVRFVDYRDLPQSGTRFDRVANVGMVERVGRENYGKFMDCADKVLNPGGVFLFRFISSQKKYAGDPQIKKYIFPGGVIPGLREIISLMAGHDFCVLDVENLRNHYNKTLLCWGRNFREYEEEIKDMFDEEFVHM